MNYLINFILIYTVSIILLVILGYIPQIMGQCNGIRIIDFLKDHLDLTSLVINLVISVIYTKFFGANKNIKVNSFTYISGSIVFILAAIIAYSFYNCNHGIL